MKHPAYGFRFSLVDAVVVVVTVLSLPWLMQTVGLEGALPAYVVFHFFLFCNVFRIRRCQELLWSAGFVVLLLNLQLSDVAVWSVMFWHLPVSVVVIWWETRHWGYHGIFAVQWNPLLELYLAQSPGLIGAESQRSVEDGV